ncbi:N-formylglutamate amidohydrolase [Actinoplanes sp. TBRC 11911]|uniref:N-formylglutamate amidohydrolase n=1 Tax=Actinoplanes sp. TBRC 11911 TaxID=2729386 RepID=UPI001B7D5333|nr:N-formylglutamate amidohydrolase [Actinoplanes sp. TBRC 11911]
MTYAIFPGTPDSPVILHVPHASRSVAGAEFTISPSEVATELDHLTDAYTDMIARQAAGASASRPWIFENRLSRLVVDPERFPDESEEMRAVGMGAVYTHGYARRRLRSDDPVRDEALLRTHFRPYAAAMTDLVGERLAATGRAVVIDVHSYPAVALPYELHASGPRPEICLGSDAFHTPPVLLEAASTAFSRFKRYVNSPFAGAYVPLAHYRRSPEVTALMIEIRRDQYMIEPAGAPTAGLDVVAAALAHLVDAA